MYYGYYRRGYNPCRRRYGHGCDCGYGRGYGYGCGDRYGHYGRGYYPGMYDIYDDFYPWAY